MDRVQPVITRRFSEVALRRSRGNPFPWRAKPLKRLGSVRPLHTSLKRGVNENDHSDAADSFCGCCFVGAGRTTAARSDAFLRRK